MPKKLSTMELNLLRQIAGLHKRSDSTIIVISHQERIIRLADEVVLVAGGRVTARGSFDEVMPLMDKQDMAECALKEA